MNYKNQAILNIMNSIPKYHTMLSVSYIAKKLNVNPRLVRNYIYSGKLEAIALPSNNKRSTGVYRVPTSAFQAFLEEYSTFNEAKLKDIY